MMDCPYCGKLTDPKLESCPHCGGFLQQKAPPQSRNVSKGRQTCPNCRALVQEGDIICVVCGTNLLTGQKIGAEAPKTTPRRNYMPWLVGGGIVALVAIVVGSLWGYVITRDPVNQALSLIKDRQYDQAMVILEAYVVSVSNDGRAWNELGHLQLKANQFLDAARSFEQVVGLSPANTDAAYWAVVSLASSNAPGVGSRQTTLLKDIVEEEPRNARAWYLLSLARGANGDSKGQVEALKEVLALQPSHDAARRSMGVGLALNGEYDEARRELGAAERAAHSTDIIALLGFVDALRGDSDGAASSLEEALNEGGLSVRWEAVTQLGKLLMEQGRFREAEEYLAQALTMRQGNETPRYLHALALLAGGQRQGALSEFESLTKANRGYAAEAALQTARIYLTQGDTPRAQAAIQRAVQLEGRSAAYHTAQGRVLSAMGNEVLAQDAFRKAVSLDPLYPPAHLENGLQYIKREALTEGLEELELYLELIGPDAAGTRAFEIRTLTEQLRQTTGRGAGARRRAKAYSGKVAS